ncbi:MAG TPA: TIGR03667 family PPOX class F420-dependent oxidoreductase, partial [Anaerolineales bacterium]|nr:TIGR03667 family PPOX class F420-dependent oxidoreductase [Anaerolineales bacterium]
MIQFKGRFGRRARRRLKKEKIIWLTTVGPDGTPQPRPVWFVWDEAKRSVLIYSQPEGHKLQHLERNPRVALHFNSDDEGGDVVVFTGKARIDRASPPVHRRPNYVRKYRSGIRDLEL